MPMFVAGEWTGAASAETFSADSPATGETLGEVPQGDGEDARRATAAANDASTAWSRETASARLVVGGSRTDGFPTDLYWQPTIPGGVPPDARVAVEETFGPVAPVVAIDSLEQAIELGNASPVGGVSAMESFTELQTVVLTP